MRYWLLFCVLCFVVQQYIATPVNDGNKDDQEAFEDVKELESLRTEHNKANTSEQNHQNEATSKAPLQPESTPEPEPQPNSRSAIFRHRGITQAKKSKLWNEKVDQPTDVYTKYAGIQDSPKDLANYVFVTGDEEGVALAVEEFVREGLMGRTDAINYLQDVKQQLAILMENQKQKRLEELKNRAFLKAQLAQRLPNLQQEQQFMSRMEAEKPGPKDPQFAPTFVVKTEHPHQEVIASTSEPKGHAHASSTTTRPKIQSTVVAEAFKQEDKECRTSEKRAENYDFALQIIYRLAKDMFTESIIKDDPVAEDTLSRLVAFMESEVGNNRISPEVKQKVLAIISNALVDSLREYQSMMPENKGPMFDESNFYRHLSGQNTPSASKLEMPESYRKLTVGSM